MANKRMMNMKICESDAFLDMPMSTQCLYFHFNMLADDDGFVGAPKSIMRSIGASEDDLKILIAKSFVLIFEDSGVIVIKHWRLHNTISKTRYHETSYLEEKRMLRLKDNGAYSFTEGDPIDDTHYIEMFAENKRRTNGEQTENTEQEQEQEQEQELELDSSVLIDSLHSSITHSSDETSDTLAEEIKAQVLDIKVDEIVNEYNRVCTNLPKVQKITKKRRKQVKARLKAFDEKDIYKAFEKANFSRFLCGGGDKGFKASFDWFFDNDNNLQKVLEGVYDNSKKPRGGFNNFSQRAYDMQELEDILINNSG